MLVGMVYIHSNSSGVFIASQKGFASYEYMTSDNAG